jgi:putative DNA methylase
MKIYSQYSNVIRASGEPVTVREALIEINNAITAYHEKETGELDSETLFCLTWMKKHGYMEGVFGDAQLLATAKDVDISKMHNRLLIAERGQVRLLTGDEFAEHDYSDEMSAWETCARMAWHLEIGERRGGIQGCVDVARAMGSGYESAERLARLLYTHYVSRGDSQNAMRYNSLVTEWRVISDEIGLNAEQLELTRSAL